MIFTEDYTEATPRLDGVGDDEAGCDQAWMPQSEADHDGLSVIRVSDGDGQFLLTAPLSGEPFDVTVDIAPGALRLRSGRISRWVPLPVDALVDHAVIQHSDETLTVTIPERERRCRRHIIHVW